jgi:hypothetical protein
MFIIMNEQLNYRRKKNEDEERANIIYNSVKNACVSKLS